MSENAKLPGGQSLKWLPANYPTIYTNIMAVSWNAFDVSLILGQIGETAGIDTLATPQAKIIMTPEQASNMHKLLGVIVGAYIESNGPLRTAGAVDVEEVQRQIEEQKAPK
jgi:hypothetical protein